MPSEREAGCLDPVTAPLFVPSIPTQRTGSASPPPPWSPPPIPVTAEPRRRERWRRGLLAVLGVVAVAALTFGALYTYDLAHGPADSL